MPLRILIVEDNPDTAESMRLLLSVLGAEGRVCLTGTDGVREARQWLPDAVVCDIGLPGLDGYEVARLLRAGPETASIPLVAVTGYAGEEDRQRALAAGFDEVFAKPADFRQVMEFLLRRRLARGEL